MRISKSFSFTAECGDSGKRCDAFLASRIENLSRSALAGPLCEISVNGKPVKKSFIIHENDFVELNYVADVFEKVEPQNIELDILYEDSNMLVINKKSGMVVHPGAGNVNGTVANALAYRYGESFIDEMSDECDVSRPGIVHRLDKDTSGVLVIALNSTSHAYLSEQFSKRKTEKHYLAYCNGIFGENSGEIRTNIVRDKNNRKLFTVSETKGKEAWTEYSVLRRYEKYSLLDVKIHTGRTHQIRVHMKSLGHPVVGDELYFKSHGLGLMLHSHTLKICHPVTHEEMLFTAPVPERFALFEKEITS